MKAVRIGYIGVLAVLFLGFSGMAAAGSNVDIVSVDAPSFVESGETVQLAVEVNNTAGKEVHQMEVKVKGFDQVKEENLWNMKDGESDTLEFHLTAPTDEKGTHQIEITVQSRDDDGRVIGGERENISIDVEESGAVVGPTKGDLEVEEVAMPGTVLAGETFTMDVTVRNTGEGDMSGLHVSVRAFGRRTTTEAGVINGESTRTVPVKVSVPEAASGREEAKIEVSTFDAEDSINTTISISDFHATLQLRQETVTVGDHVTVSGILNRRNTRVDLFYAGRFVAPVFSDNTGHFTHTLIPEKPGVFPVALVKGTVRIEKLLTVKPRLEVREVAAPDRVGVNSPFDVCGVLSRGSPAETELRLLVDGRVEKTASVAVRDRTEHCFSTSLPSEGTHTVRLEMASGGVTASDQAEVKAVQTGITASVFPDQLTLTKGQAGIFQISIDNDRLESRQFDISVEGFQGVEVDSPGTVSLAPGRSKTAALRVIPQDTGSYSATVTVSQDGTVITETDVGVLAVENPALKNPVIGGAARWAGRQYETFQGLRQRQKWIVLGAIGAVLLSLLWLWRRRGSEVIEPQY